MIRAFCFDMDGVLFDTERLGGTLIADVIAAQGFTIEEAQWKSLIGPSWPYTYQKLVEWFPGFDVARFEHDWKETTFVNYFKANGVPYKKGAVETLASLKARGFRLALCTSNLPEVVRMYLDLAGWSDTFDFIVTADMVPRSKPAPDIYLRAAALMGVAPSECVGVEDSTSGVHAVHAAGMCCVMIPDMIPYSEDVHKPCVDILLDDLTQLEQAVANHFPA